MTLCAHCLLTVNSYYRSSSGGTKRSSGVMGRGSQQGPKRTVSGGSGAPRSGSPVVGSRSEKESALSLVKQLSQPHQDQDQTHQEPEQPQQVESLYTTPLYCLYDLNLPLATCSG